MAFRVEIAPRALSDLDAIAEYITERGSFEQAEQWFNGIVDAIASLKDMPRRCPVAAESKELGREVRLLLHGKGNRRYKIYLSVCPETSTTGVVRVFHVRHWARQELKPGIQREYEIE